MGISEDGNAMVGSCKAQREGAGSKAVRRQSHDKLVYDIK